MATALRSLSRDGLRYFLRQRSRSPPHHAHITIAVCAKRRRFRRSFRFAPTATRPLASNASRIPFYSTRNHFLLFTSRVGFVVCVKAARFLSNGDSCGICPRRIRCRACPRSGFRCRPALQQPVVHRRGRVRHGLVRRTYTSSFLLLRVLLQSLSLSRVCSFNRLRFFCCFFPERLRELFTHFLEHFLGKLTAYFLFVIQGCHAQTIGDVLYNALHRKSKLLVLFFRARFVARGCVRVLRRFL